MNFKEFEYEIDKLKKVYGSIKYPQERTSVMFEYLGTLPYEAFEKQVKKFIASSEKAPLLSDFEIAFTSQMADLKKESINKKIGDAPYCTHCGNTGHITMYLKATGHEYAFQCTCIRGHYLQPTFSKQYPNMGEEYASHRAYVAGKFDKLAVLRKDILCQTQSLELSN